MKSLLKNLISLMNKWDYCLILILLISALVFFILIHKSQNKDTVVIEYNNMIFKTVSLQENQLINVDNHMIIEIKNSKVRIKQSDCHNQLCVKQGWSDSFPLICVPNHVLVKIESHQNNKHQKKVLITY